MGNIKQIADKNMFIELSPFIKGKFYPLKAFLENMFPMPPASSRNVLGE
jgi:hypothetical protein